MDLTYSEVNSMINRIMDSIMGDKDRRGLSDYLIMLQYDKGTRYALWHQMAGIKLVDNIDAREKFVRIVTDKILDSWCEQGTYVAIISTDAIMMKFIHSTLQSPHSVGKMVQIGGAIGKLTNILSATSSKSNPNVISNIYISLYDKLDLKSVVSSYRHRIIGQTLKDLVVDYEIIVINSVDNDDSIDFSWFNMARDIVGKSISIQEGNYILRVTLDLFKIYSTRANIFDIVTSLNSGGYWAMISPILRSDDTGDYILYLDIIVDSPDVGSNKVLSKILSLSNSDMRKSISQFKKIIEHRIDTIRATKNPDENKLIALEDELDKLERDIKNNESGSGNVEMELVYPYLLLNKYDTFGEILISGIRGITDIMPKIYNINRCLYRSYYHSAIISDEYGQTISISDRPREGQDVIQTNWIVILDRNQMNIGGYSLYDVKHVLSYPSLGFKVVDYTEDYTEGDNDNILDSLFISVKGIESNESWIRSNFIRLEDDKIRKAVYSEIRSRLSALSDLDISTYSEHTERINVIMAVESRIYEIKSIPRLKLIINPGDVQRSISDVDEIIQTFSDYLDEILTISRSEYKTYMDRKNVSSSIPFSLSEYVIVSNKRDMKRAEDQRKKIKDYLGSQYSYLHPQIDREIIGSSTVIMEYLEEYLDRYKTRIDELIDTDDSTVPDLVRIKVISRIVNNIQDYLNLTISESINTISTSMNSSITRDQYSKIDVSNLFGVKYRVIDDKIVSDIRSSDIGRASSDPILIINSALKDDNEFQTLNSKSKILSDGFNLEDVLLDIGVDNYCTYSDDIFTSFDLGGIEFTRRIMIESFTSLADSNSLRIAIVHILLTVDVMTSSGIPRSYEPHGDNYINNIMFRNPHHNLYQTVKGSGQSPSKISKFKGEFFGYSQPDVPDVVREKVDKLRSMNTGINYKDIYKTVDDMIDRSSEPYYTPVNDTVVGEKVSNTIDDEIEKISEFWDTMG